MALLLIRLFPYFLIIKMFILFFCVPLCYELVDLSISQLIIEQHKWVPDQCIKVYN